MIGALPFYFDLYLTFIIPYSTADREGTAKQRGAEDQAARENRLRGVRVRAAANRERSAAVEEATRRQRTFLTNIDQPVKKRNAYYVHPCLPAYRNDYDFYKAKVHTHKPMLLKPHLTIPSSL